MISGSVRNVPNEKGTTTFSRRRHCSRKHTPSNDPKAIPLKLYLQTKDLLELCLRASNGREGADVSLDIRRDGIVVVQSRDEVRRNSLHAAGRSVQRAQCGATGDILTASVRGGEQALLHSLELVREVPQIAKYMAAVQYKIIVFQGQFSVLPAFSIENSNKQVGIYIAIRST